MQNQKLISPNTKMWAGVAVMVLVWWDGKCIFSLQKAHGVMAGVHAWVLMGVWIVIM